MRDAVRLLLFGLLLGWSAAVLADTPAVNPALTPAVVRQLPVGTCPTWGIAQENGTSGTFAVLLDWGTPWQPRGGVVRFSVNGTGFAPAVLTACFRLAGTKDETWLPLPGLNLEKVVPAESSSSYTFRVPGNLSAETLPLLGRQIEIRLSAIDGNGILLIDTLREVRVTSVGLAGVVAVAAVLLAAFAIWQTRRSRAVPGGDWLLSLIASSDGRASLSQAQIMLWTFIISGSAVFVLMLSGNLVEIGNKVLWLLGIAGVAVVAAKVKDAPKIEGGLTAVPAAVTALAASVKEDTVRLSWTAPPGDWRTAFYAVTRELLPGEAEPVVGKLLRPWFVMLQQMKGHACR